MAGKTVGLLDLLIEFLSVVSGLVWMSSVTCSVSSPLAVADVGSSDFSPELESCAYVSAMHDSLVVALEMEKSLLVSMR